MSPFAITGIRGAAWQAVYDRAARVGRIPLACALLARADEMIESITGEDAPSIYVEVSGGSDAFTLTVPNDAKCLFVAQPGPGVLQRRHDLGP